jgi:hypothetical protein
MNREKQKNKKTSEKTKNHLPPDSYPAWTKTLWHGEIRTANFWVPKMYTYSNKLSYCKHRECFQAMAFMKSPIHARVKIT